MNFDDEAYSFYASGIKDMTRLYFYSILDDSNELSVAIYGPLALLSLEVGIFDKFLSLCLNWDGVQLLLST